LRHLGIARDDQVPPVSLQIIDAARGYVATAAQVGAYEIRHFHMMRVNGDGKRMYVTNSLLSTLDHSGRFYVRLVQLGPHGMKVDPFFNIHLPTGPARGHDMLLN
jgi:hypothetical protein